MLDCRVPASPAGPGFGPSAWTPAGDSDRTKNTLMPVENLPSANSEPAAARSSPSSSGWSVIVS
jgi:hypothetical protein